MGIIQGAAVVGSSRPMLHQRLATPLPALLNGSFVTTAGQYNNSDCCHVSTILPSSSKNAYNRVEFERGNISRKPKRKRQGKEEGPYHLMLLRIALLAYKLSISNRNRGKAQPSHDLWE
jgi:hypothetical protein